MNHFSQMREVTLLEAQQVAGGIKLPDAWIRPTGRYQPALDMEFSNDRMTDLKDLPDSLPL